MLEFFGVVYMRATTNFETKRLLGAICLHVVDLHDIAVPVTELPKGVLFVDGYVGWIFMPGHNEMMGDLFVDDVLYLAYLLWC